MDDLAQRISDSPELQAYLCDLLRIFPNRMIREVSICKIRYHMENTAPYAMLHKDFSCE